MKDRPTDDVGDACDFCDWVLVEKRIHRSGPDNIALGAVRVFRCFQCGTWKDTPIDRVREITHAVLKRPGRVVPLRAVEEQQTILEHLQQGIRQ